jgi:hypothetical protein
MPALVAGIHIFLRARSYPHPRAAEGKTGTSPAMTPEDGSAWPERALAAKVTSPIRMMTVKTIVAVSPIWTIPWVGMPPIIWTIAIEAIRVGTPIRMVAIIARPPIIWAVTVESIGIWPQVRTIAIIVMSPIIRAAVKAIGIGSPIRTIIAIIRSPIVGAIAVRGIRPPVGRSIVSEMRSCEAKTDGDGAAYAARRCRSARNGDGRGSD